MDMTTCLKSLLLAIQQYREGRTAQLAAQLQKQVEEVSGLKCERLLCSGQALPSECVSGLVELAGHPNTNTQLTSAIISLLAQLASDDSSRELLHSSYNLTSCLSSVIHCHSATPGEPPVLQCLQLLQKLTYNTQVFQSTNYIHELILFLVKNIQSPNDDLIMPCLGVLANLCRDNHSVQSHIKSLDNVRALYRTLIHFLAHNSLTVVVFTLSILSSLTLNEKVGEKLFDAKNIHQTFQLVFNIIVNGNGTLTRKYSVDLLVDLLRSPKIADCLTRYEHFSACVSQVLGLLQSKDPDSVAKVLELLLALCSVCGLRSLMCSVVFKPIGPRLRGGGTAEGGRGGGGGRRGGGGLDPGVALLQWLRWPVEGAEACSIQTLMLLCQLMEEALSAESVSECVLGFIEILLPVLLTLLNGLDLTKGEKHVRKHCHMTTHVTSLMLILCTDNSSRCLVSAQLSAQLCLSQVEALLSCCHGNGPGLGPAPSAPSAPGPAPFTSTLTCSSITPGGADQDLSQVCAEAVLKTLELMSKLRQQVKDMETSFYRMLQDQRIVTPLSLALTSHHRNTVQTGLSLLFEASALPDFPSAILGESIAANNAYRQREAELSVKRVAVQEVPPPNPLDTSCGSARGVHSLVEKIQNGLELQESMKDCHVSEIISVYEQKISAFASKERGLVDLLEAKAAALSQSDRLISQYRLQRAQAEAEASKLGSLLKEAELRREDLTNQLRVQVLEVERSKTDTQQLLTHNARLQHDSEAHQELKGAYNALLNRLSESERVLSELQAAHLSLNKQTETLKRNHDNLQLQHHKMGSVLEERNQQISSLQSELQQRDSHITSLKEEVKSEKERLEEKLKEKSDLEENVDVLRRELNKTEQARKESSIKASSLELQKSQLEVKLKQREEELGKHSSMIAMIHSLSSGNKVKGEVNLSL